MQSLKSRMRTMSSIRKRVLNQDQALTEQNSNVSHLARTERESLHSRRTVSKVQQPLNTAGMIDLVFQKGKEARKLVVCERLGEQWLQANVTQNIHLRAGLQAFLSNLIREGRLTNQLRDIDSEVFKSIEQFIVQKVRSRFVKERAQKGAAGLESSISAKINGRIEELRGRLNSRAL